MTMEAGSEGCCVDDLEMEEEALFKGLQWPQELGKAREQSALKPLEGLRPCWYPDFGPVGPASEV